jgi:hypothetical protein
MGGTTQTSTTSMNSQSYSTTTTGSSQALNYGGAASVFGGQAMGGAAAYAGRPDPVGAFGTVVGQDTYAHPYNDGFHVLGLALPFTGISTAAEGITTGVEALKTAYDLQKEAHGSDSQ